MAHIKLRGAVQTPLTQVFTVSNNAEKIETLQEILTRTGNGLRQDMQNLDFKKNNLCDREVSVAQWKSAMALLKVSFQHDSSPVKQNEKMLHNEIHALEVAISYIATLEERIKNAQEKLQAVGEQLQQLLTNSETVQITAEEIIERFCSHPLVSNAPRHRPKIYRNPWTHKDEFVIVFRTNPVKCVARDYGAYPCIVKKDIEPFVMLPPMTIEMDLSMSNIRVFAQPRQGRGSGYNRNSPHPHILRQNQPCLGDFAANIAEAYETRDYIAILDILQVFLENATLSDGAGKSWLHAWANVHIGTGELVRTFVTAADGSIEATVLEPDPEGGLRLRPARHKVSHNGQSQYIKQLYLPDINPDSKIAYVPVFWPHYDNVTHTLVYDIANDRFFNRDPYQYTNSAQITPPENFIIRGDNNASNRLDEATGQMRV